jgi:site-specific recombinase XerD
VTSGIRLEELANSTHKDMRLESLPGLPATWILTVTGKRNKTREVPLNPDVVHMLAVHGGNLLAAELGKENQTELPLILTLHASVAQWSRGQDGDLVVGAKSENAGTALSASGIYAVLKRFFRQAAKTADASGLDARRFQKASTHWMRHTFARQALVDGVPIEVVSENLGHLSIATTTIYSTQELARKIKAVQGMKRRVLS